MRRGIARRTLLGGLGASSLVHMAQAQSAYPSRPIRFVVPFAAGGAVDVVARAIGRPMTTNLGQQIIIDNRTGANTAIGADYVAHARPDGYTLMISGSTTMVLGPLLYKKLPYRPSDFAPVSLLTKVPMVAAVNESVKGTLPEIIDRIRQAPNDFTYGHTGMGGIGHLLGESLFMKYDLRLTSVPYRGFPATAGDMMGGLIQMTFESVAAVLPLHRADKVRIVAVSSPERLPELPNIPTFAELGFADLTLYAWFAMLAPAGTEDSILRRLSQAVAVGSADAEYRRLAEGTGQQISNGTPEQLASLIEQDIARWRPVIEKLDLKLD